MFIESTVGSEKKKMEPAGSGHEYYSGVDTTGLQGKRKTKEYMWKRS